LDYLINIFAVTFLCKRRIESIQSRVVENMIGELAGIFSDGDLQIDISGTSGFKRSHASRHGVNVDSAPTAKIKIVSIRIKCWVMRPHIHVETVGLSFKYPA